MAKTPYFSTFWAISPKTICRIGWKSFYKFGFACPSTSRDPFWCPFLARLILKNTALCGHTTRGLICRNRRMNRKKSSELDTNFACSHNPGRGCKCNFDAFALATTGNRGRGGGGSASSARWSQVSASFRRMRARETDGASLIRNFTATRHTYNCHRRRCEDSPPLL